MDQFSFKHDIDIIPGSCGNIKKVFMYFKISFIDLDYLLPLGQGDISISCASIILFLLYFRCI